MVGTRVHRIVAAVVALVLGGGATAAAAPAAAAAAPVVARTGHEPAGVVEPAEVPSSNPAPSSCGPAGWNSVFVSHPQNLTLDVGERDWFIARLSREQPQIWQVSTDDAATWADIPGSNNSGTLPGYLVPPATLDMDGWLYRVMVRGGTVPQECSVPAKLTVRGASTAPVVATHPQDTTVPAGGAAEFTSTATGTPTPGVQWQSAPPGGDWSDVPGATSTTYTIPSADPEQHGTQVRAVFSNSAGSVTTDPATLGVVPVCAPVELPRVSATGQPGGRARLTIAGAEGGVPASGSGRVAAPSGTRIVGVDTDGVPGASFMVSEDGRTAQSDRTDFPGAPATVSVTVEIDPDVPSGTYLEDGQAQVLDDGGCPVVGVGLTVAAYAASLEVVQQPQDQVVYAPRAAEFTARAEVDADTPMAVRWQVLTAGLWLDVPGATAGTLRVEHTRLDQDGSRYRAVFSTLTAEAITDEAVLTVLEAPPLHLTVTPRVQLVDALPSGGAVQRATKGGLR